jgi:(1->4)-alpha-D-glucan 1-alpha-D-glucosylmutase
VPLDEVHAALTALSVDQPGTFVPLTTHDTKRSGDVRARLSRLAGDPEKTVGAFVDWCRLAARHRSPAGPGPAAEWLLWTSVVGAWPIDADRLAAFATKAGREAKDHTSWTDPDPAYEDAVDRFVRGVVADPATVDEVDTFVASLLAEGRAASLALVALACTAAGSPDLYQGDEVWNLALVDPDNRRPVDPVSLAELLDRAADPGLDLAALWARTAADPAADGLVKMATWHRLLDLRASRAVAFTAPHTQLPVEGHDHSGVLAFRRGDEVAVVANVRPTPGPVRGRVSLPPGPWQDVLTGTGHSGGVAELADLLAGLPVTALVRP